MVVLRPGRPEEPFARTAVLRCRAVRSAARSGRRYRGGENQEWFRVISRGEVLADRAELTARPDDQTLDGYIERLGRTLAGTDYMVLVNEVQALSPSVFEATATLLTGLYGQIGMPAGGANLTLIAGDYRLTPFGLHKDEADILTFVVRGRKRLLLWPFEDLRGALGHDTHLQPRHSLPPPISTSRPGVPGPLSWRARPAMCSRGHVNGGTSPKMGQTRRSRSPWGLCEPRIPCGSSPEQ